MNSKHSATLMRINHSGEVCAQALYLGQALVARTPKLTATLYQAALEESEHLRWCKERITALQGRTSYLNPLWAVGSFGIGVIAGLLGDKVSLGFIAETEQQVSAHLSQHLESLAADDLESRAILIRMQQEEEAHASKALENGGVALPRLVRYLMKGCAKVMTFTTQYF